MIPTADDIAWAIVAASRETGESAIDCAERKMGIRCRHYAMHALKAVFPDLPREAAANVVGCTGKPLSFWNNSMSNCASIFTATEKASRAALGYPARDRVSPWWNELAFAKVIDAVRASVQSRRQFVSAPQAERALPSDPYSRARELIPSNPAQITMRKAARPAWLCEDMTAELMGDPAPSRSALADRHAVDETN